MQESQWVSVNERMPELISNPVMWPVSVPVLAALEYGGLAVVTYEKTQEDKPGGEWYTDDSNKEEVSVAYWMEIPNIPVG